MNDYDWHPWFAWYRPRGAKWLRWNECRLVGEIAPNGDLGSGWEYRLPQKD